MLHDSHASAATRTQISSPFSSDPPLQSLIRSNHQSSHLSPLGSHLEVKESGMGLLFLERLEGEGVFRCRQCRVDAASRDSIISKDFYGRYGRAYLFDHVVNICLGPKEDRYLITGLHTVNDIYCSCCQQILGWRYEKAYDESQKYKEGKFILERGRMVKD